MISTEYKVPIGCVCVITGIYTEVYTEYCKVNPTPR